MEVCWLPGRGLRERFGKGLALVQRLEVDVRELYIFLIEFFFTQI